MAPPMTINEVILDSCLILGLALVLSYIILRIQLTYAPMKQNIRELGPQNHHAKHGTPSSGGIAVLIGLMLPALFWLDWSSIETVAVVTLTLAFAGVGLLDDSLKIRRGTNDGLSAIQKLALQFLISGLVFGLCFIGGDSNLDTTFGNLHIPFLSLTFEVSEYLWLIPSVILVVFMSNSVNLTDGLDGLMIPLAIIAAVATLIVGAIVGVNIWPFVPLVAGFVGASFAFLWFNFHPAQIFLGDVGSLAFGAMITGIAIVLGLEAYFLIIAAVFILEGLSVMIQVGWFKYTRRYFGKGQRFFAMAPYHHHLEQGGMHETKVTGRLWLLGKVCAGVAIVLATLTADSSAALLTNWASVISGWT